MGAQGGGLGFAGATEIISPPDQIDDPLGRAAVLAAIGQKRGALAVLESIDPSRFTVLGADRRWAMYPRSLLERGALYEQLGDRTKAAAAYERYVELMRDADAVIQPQVRLARARLAALRDPRAPHSTPDPRADPIVVAILLLVLLGACARSAERPVPRPVPFGRVASHVLIISIDGLRPDAIERFGAPTLGRLVQEGSFAAGAQTVLPSTTLPSHASMLTGVEPAVHGITWNTDRVAERGYVRVPTVFGLARAAGLRTAAFFGKSKLHHVHPPATLDHVELLDGRASWRRSSERTAQLFGRHLERERPNLVFVHFGEADQAGHLFGWMGRLYGEAVLEADAAVAAVLEQADARFGRGEYTVIVTADHGGHGRTHGTGQPEDTTIPWIAWGKGVRAGTRLSFGVRTTDTAATVLWLLGIPVPPEWSGYPVTQAFLATDCGMRITDSPPREAASCP